jgi:glucosylceramidase
MDTDMVFMQNKYSHFIFLVFGYTIFLIFSGCTKGNDGKDQTPEKDKIVIAQTSFDKSVLFRIDTISANIPSESAATITLDETQVFQTMDGFGYSLTGASALNLYGMNATVRKEVLNHLFDCQNGNCVSYLRISIGASDLDEKVFSYNDLPSGQTDFDLSSFDISQDKKYLIPVLKEILTIQPDIKIMASPWSPPKWMKTNNSSVGGSLKQECYDVYSRYLLKYIQSMANEGIKIDALTLQNEPQHGGNNPSMLMSATEQAAFIKNHVGPLFKTGNITTKIVIWDHNCDQYDYPLSILRDSAAKPYVDGSAFHLYAGDISALSVVRNEFPEKNIYFTEQWTGANSSFSDDLKWHSRNLLIGATRNWAKVVLEWNLATNPAYGPYTPGGCSLCKGAITIDKDLYSYNVSYYLIAHMSKFIVPGSKRIFSSYFESSPNVAFLRPDGKTVLFIMNESSVNKPINIKSGNRSFSVNLRPASIHTLLW